MVLIRDGHGGLIPLVRDAAAGFKEPTHMGLPATSVSALGIHMVLNKVSSVV